MQGLLTELFTALTTALTGITGGIKDAFLNILYVDPDATTLVVSDLAKFGFIMLGVSVAFGLVWLVIGMIRGRA